MKSHSPINRQATFQFYDELNDFLPKANQNRRFDYTFAGQPAVKDIIEAIGVPHIEVDAIFINDKFVLFDRQINGGDTVKVYPRNSRFSQHLVPPFPNENRFVVDVNLGKLAPKLRLLGFDTYYRNNLDDREIVSISARENRIVLTRDVGILKYKHLSFGYWVREIQPHLQIKEVVKKFTLYQHINPFTICSQCNGKLKSVKKELIIDKVPRKTAENFEKFMQCDNCGKIYWQGSHVKEIKRWIDRDLSS